jgi:hypothetical protein
MYNLLYSIIKFLETGLFCFVFFVCHHYFAVLLLNHAFDKYSIEKRINTEKFGSMSIIKEEIILDQRQVAFLSPSKICENLIF